MFFPSLFPDNPNLNTNSWENTSLTNTVSSETILPLANYYNYNSTAQTSNTTGGPLVGGSIRINGNNNNHNNNNNIIKNNNKLKRLDKLENNISSTTAITTTSSTTNNIINSDDSSWFSETAGLRSEREISSDDENASDRSLTSGTQRNSQLRTTFIKAKNHLSFDKWRSNSLNNSNSSGGGNTIATGNTTAVPAAAATVTSTTTTAATITAMPTNQESPPGESFSRLSRWFSMRRGSIHQYDIRSGSGSGNGGDRENRRNSLDSSLHNEEIHNSRLSKLTGSVGGVGSGGGGVSGNISKKMPKLPESEEDPTIYGMELDMSQNSNLFTLKGERSYQMPPALPAAPAGLDEQQIKRRHIVAAIIHSENSYVATLQRLVNVSRK